MNGGLSIHVVDVSRGVVAAGMKIEVHAAGDTRQRLCTGEINARGVLDDPVLMSAAIVEGTYEVVFHVADWYRAAGIALPARPFLDVVHYRFSIGDARQHYHLPMKLTPWGYSCFRGGA
ncbi:MAG: hydroxyisourate hydrolase [Burkholderiales bacterium]|nr:hydroxyisourate hydrolase [Burkholderiales bacterium]